MGRDNVLSRDKLNSNDQPPTFFQKKKIKKLKPLVRMEADLGSWNTPSLCVFRHNTVISNAYVSAHTRIHSFILTANSFF
ncbi:hypothetical protein HanIR_Chr08g0350511 [Helianthus annuus]|nr:hypothetical protein HanIR_Chr08g0350511 [Helianthus annuus]